MPGAILQVINFVTIIGTPNIHHFRWNGRKYNAYQNYSDKGMYFKDVTRTYMLEELRYGIKYAVVYVRTRVFFWT